MPFFTVVIPTYNRAEKLKNTIHSVLEQTYSDFELLVMDDGSTDHTEEAVNSFADNRIRYEWAPNSGGPATPRNRGIDASCAPWISFLDADDVWYPTRLEHVAETIKNHSSADVFCHNEMLNVIGSNEKTLLKCGPYQHDFYRIMLTQGNRLSTSAVTIRTEFLLAHQLRFNQSGDYVIIEDYDLWLRLAEKGAGFTFIGKPLGEYIIESDNISHATARARHNLQVLLRDHVYHIQQFESDKDKLWREICLRLDLEEAKDLLTSGKFYNGLRLMVGSAFPTPLLTLKLLSSKLHLKIARSRLA